MLFDSAGPVREAGLGYKLFTPVSPAELEKFDALLMPHPPQPAGLCRKGHSSDVRRARVGYPSRASTRC